MSDLFIKKESESVIKVLSEEEHVKKELEEFFKFKDPNCENSWRYKTRKWDGMIRLYKIKTGRLPAGLLFYVAKFARERGYKVSLDPELKRFEKIDKDALSQWANSLDLRSGGKEIEPYWYQLDLLHTALEWQKSTLLAATSAGKSLSIYLICRYLLDNKQISDDKRILILVPSVNLVGQLLNDFKDYSSANGWDTEAHCHEVYSGQEKTSGKKIIISTWQSLYTLPKEYFKQFEGFIGDEAHLASGDSIQGIGKMCTNAWFRLGTTGTLKELPLHALQVQGVFGKVKRIVTNKQLQDGGQAAKARIIPILLKHPDHARKTIEPDYHKEMDFLCNCTARNEFILNLVKSLKGNTLVLFQFVDKHGKPLYELLNAETDKDVMFISGEVDKDDRNDIRAHMEANDNCVCVASYGTTSTGWSVKNLHNIILASPSKSKVRVLQSLGRGLRLHVSKDHFKLLDIGDDLSDKGKANFTLNHMRKRVEMYLDEQFEVDFKQYALRY